MKTFSLLCGVGLALIATSASADPMSKKGWSPQQNANRAAIASLMMQHEQMRNPVPSYAGAIFTCGGSGGGGNGGAGAGNGAGGAGGSTNSSQATANNNCIIVVGSNGTVIDSDQVSSGDQTSNTNTQSASNENSMSSILESME